MKYRIIWKLTTGSVWRTMETDNENEALIFYKELVCTQKEIWVKRRIGYSILNNKKPAFRRAFLLYRNYSNRIYNHLFNSCESASTRPQANISTCIDR